MFQPLRQLRTEIEESLANILNHQSNLICYYFVVILGQQAMADPPVDSIELEANAHSDDDNSTLSGNTGSKKVQ